MATLATILTRARIKARDTESLIHSDTQLIALVNGVLAEIYGDLQRVESNLVHAEGTISLVDGTGEYTPTWSFNGIMDDGVWISGEDEFLVQIDEALKIKYNYTDANCESEPEAYYLTEDGKIGFLPVPDTAYTAYALYWKPLTELTATTDTVPWYGIWDPFLTERLAAEMLAVQERSAVWPSMVMDRMHDQAMAKVFNRGCRLRRRKTAFFAADGV